MFQQLVPLLRQRSVLLTVTALEEDQIRVNVLPKKLAEGENVALTTPMSFTGTAAEFDAQLPNAIVSFVASHLELKNALGRAKEEMAAAAKAAQEEAGNKSKTAKKAAPAAEPVKKEDQKTAKPPKVPSLFDMPAPVGASPTPHSYSDEEAEILAEMNQDEETEEEDEVLVNVALNVKWPRFINRGRCESSQRPASLLHERPFSSVSNKNPLVVVSRTWIYILRLVRRSILLITHISKTPSD